MPDIKLINEALDVIILIYVRLFEVSRKSPGSLPEVSRSHSDLNMENDQKHN